MAYSDEVDFNPALTRRALLVKGAKGGLALTAVGALARTSPAWAQALAQGTLAFGASAEPDILDPHSAGNWTTARINVNMFEGFTSEDLTSTQRPAPIVNRLATSWSVSPDGLEYTYHLRRGVHFHDGTPFNAAAVDANIERCWNKSSPLYYPRAAALSSYYWENLRDLKVINDHTVKLILKAPFAEWPRMITQGGEGMAVFISPAALKKYGNTGIGNNPVGTGPFRFVNRVRGQKIVQQRFDGYWGRKPLLKQIVWVTLPDQAARVAALQNGQVQMIVEPPPEQRSSLSHGRYAWTQGLVPHVWYMYFNMKDPNYADPRVRKALRMAIDRKGMTASLLKSTAGVAQGLQAPVASSWGGNDPQFKDDPYDPRAAKQMIEAVHPKGFDTTWGFPVSGSGMMEPVPMATWMQRDLAKVGVRLKVDALENESFIAKWAGGLQPAGWGGALMSWGMAVNYWLSIVAHSRNIPPNGQSANVGYFNEPEVDKLLDRAQHAVSEKESTALYRQANRLIHEKAGFFPVVNDRSPIAMSSNVKGFVLPAEEYWDFTRVKVA